MTDPGDRVTQRVWLASATWNFGLACEALERDDPVSVKEYTVQGLERLSHINQETTA